MRPQIIHHFPCWKCSCTLWRSNGAQASVTLSSTDPKCLELCSTTGICPLWAKTGQFDGKLYALQWFRFKIYTLKDSLSLLQRFSDSGLKYILSKIPCRYCKEINKTFWSPCHSQFCFVTLTTDNKVKLFDVRVIKQEKEIWGALCGSHLEMAPEVLAGEIFDKMVDTCCF